MLSQAPELNRREFLRRANALSVAALAATRVTAATLPALGDVIDTHTHFYDPNRPEGVPWPPKNDELLHRTDRLVYGSNWPVSAHFTSYAQVQSLARELLQSRGTEVVEKVFSRNARRFYRLND